jgi:hypothetical protein
MLAATSYADATAWCSIASAVTCSNIEDSGCQEVAVQLACLLHQYNTAVPRQQAAVEADWEMGGTLRACNAKPVEFSMAIVFIQHLF